MEEAMKREAPSKDESKFYEDVYNAPENVYDASFVSDEE